MDIEYYVVIVTGLHIWKNNRKVNKVVGHYVHLMVLGEVTTGLLLLILFGIVCLSVLFHRHGGKNMSGPAHFEVFKDKKNKTRFRLRAPNGEIVFQSEGYESKQACLDTIAAIKEYAVVAAIQEV
jgi:uncharacterized protein